MRRQAGNRPVEMGFENPTRPVQARILSQGQGAAAGRQHERLADDLHLRRLDGIPAEVRSDRLGQAGF